MLNLALLPFLLASFEGKLRDWTAFFYSGSYHLAGRANAPQALTPQGESELRAIVGSGILADLRWPNWSDYRAHVQKFYDSGGYALAWVGKGMDATAQALAIICVLQDADSKGLSAEDYDADQGDVHFFNDIYGLDAQTEEILAKGYPYPG